MSSSALSLSKKISKRGLCRLCNFSTPSNGPVNFFEKASRDWDKAWIMQLTPWDLKGTITPPLRDIFEPTVISHIQPPSDQQHVLVPGCGSGYDCDYLASLGYGSVLGLDISPTAISFAEDNIRKKRAAATNSLKLPSNLSFQAADFFTFEAPKHVQNYHFIFDYLFFAALDLPLRPLWAASMARLLKPQSGVLATLIFPLAPADMPMEEKLKGPPYPVTLADYQAVLPAKEWEIIHINENVNSIKPRLGREQMVLWKLKQ